MLIFQAGIYTLWRYEFDLQFNVSSLLLGHLVLFCIVDIKYFRLPILFSLGSHTYKNIDKHKYLNSVYIMSKNL